MHSVFPDVSRLIILGLPWGFIAGSILKADLERLPVSDPPRMHYLGLLSLSLQKCRMVKPCMLPFPKFCSVKTIVDILHVLYNFSLIHVFSMCCKEDIYFAHHGQIFQNSWHSQFKGLKVNFRSSISTRWIWSCKLHFSKIAKTEFDFFTAERAQRVKIRYWIKSWTYHFLYNGIYNCCQCWYSSPLLPFRWSSSPPFLLHLAALAFVTVKMILHVKMIPIMKHVWSVSSHTKSVNVTKRGRSQSWLHHRHSCRRRCWVIRLRLLRQPSCCSSVRPSQFGELCSPIVGPEWGWMHTLPTKLLVSTDRVTCHTNWLSLLFSWKDSSFCSYH